MSVDQFEIDTIVVGAGAVGLAIAAELARRSSVLVLEQASGIGTGTSSRNSEVIHAGMYYEAGSLKQRLCIAGRRLLYPYLEARHIAFKRSEKLIVASDLAEVAALAKIARQGEINGVEGLSLIGPKDAARLEPALHCAASLWSRETGIFDSHGFMSALEGDLRDRGGQVVFETPVLSVEVVALGGFRVSAGGRDPVRITCRRFINAAGLFAQRVATTIDALPPSCVPGLALAKGSYFALTGRCPFQRLIYPAPVEGGLGIHLTLDLAGQARFGPDVEWLDHADPDRIDYPVDPARTGVFEDAIRRYWPGLPTGMIAPAYAGCRPKIAKSDRRPGDFVISGPDVHGIPGLVNLFAIESPGLTSALAIAEAVSSQT